MIIKSIELHNFRITRSFKKTFTNKLNVIIGDNGKGKSTIFKAIDFVIYNESDDSTLAESVTRGEKEGRVKAVINFNNKDYTLWREVKLNSKGKGTTNASISCANQDDITGSAEVNTYIKKVFPSRKLLMSSNFAMQDSNDGFINYPPSERFKEFIKIKNLDNWIKRSKRCEELVVELDNENLVNQTNLTFYETDLVNTVIVPIDITVESFIPLIESKDTLISSITNKKETLSIKIKSIDDNNIKIDKLTLDITDLTKNISSNEQNITNINSYLQTEYHNTHLDLDNKKKEYEKELLELNLKRVPVIDLGKSKVISESLKNAEFAIRELTSKKIAIQSGKCDKCGAEYEAKDVDIIDSDILERKKEVNLFQEKVLEETNLKNKIEKIKLDNVKIESRKKELNTLIDNTCSLLVKEKEVKKTKEDSLITIEDTLKRDINNRKGIEIELTSLEEIDKTKELRALNILEDSLVCENEQRDNLIKEKSEITLTIKNNEELFIKKDKLKKDIDTLKQVIEKKNIKKDKYKKLKIILGKTVPLFIILDSLKRVQTVANKFLIEVYPKNSLQFVEEKEKLLIKLRERNSMNSPFEFTTLSGFERSITKLAIRLGLANLSGTKVESIILDEFDEKATSKNSELTVQAIVKLTEDFKQVFVTTHKEQIKSYLESIGGEIIEIK